MDLRKIQETGGGTLIVSLPKKWAARSNLKRGSLVAVSERPDGRLIVDPAYARPAVLDEMTLPYPTKRADHAKWAIIGSYLLGYDVIRIRGDKRIVPKDRERVKTVIRRLIGLEILDEDACTIVAQCVIDPSLLAPKKLIQRMSVITVGMQGDAISSLIENGGQLAEAVIDRDNEVNRLYFLAVRLLRSAVRSPKLAEKFDVLPIACLDYRVAAHLIESIGDYSVQIAENALKMPKGMPDGLKSPFQALSEALSETQGLALELLLAKKGFLVDKVEMLGKIRDKHGDFLEKVNLLNNLIAKQPEKLIPYLSAASSLIDEIGRCCIDIADLGGTWFGRP